MADLTSCVLFLRNKENVVRWQFVSYCIALVILSTTTRYTQAQIPEGSMCDTGNRTVDIIDLIGTKETRDCTCKITRQGGTFVDIAISNFSCDLNIRSWKLLLFIDGCERQSLLCNHTWRSEPKFLIEETGTVSEYFLHLFKYHPQTEGATYRVRILTKGGTGEKLHIQCGLRANDVISKRQFLECVTPTPLTSATTTASTTPGTNVVGSTEDSENTENEPTLSLEAIIGIAVGGAVLVILVVIVIVICSRKSNSKKKFSEEEDSQSQYSYTRELPGGGNKNYKKQQKHAEVEKASNISMHSNPSNHQPSNSNHQPPASHTNDIIPNPYGNMENTVSNPVYQNDPVSGTGASNRNIQPGDSHTLPVSDLYARPDKLSKKKGAGNSTSSTARMIPHTDDNVSYTYYNRIVDDQFSFINNDVYSGHLGF